MAYNTKVLSSSTLSIFRECERCFWLEKNLKIKRPRGIFPSLPGGMDRILKDRYDFYRNQGAVPPEMEERGLHLFEDIQLLNQWRNFRRGIRMEILGWELMGAIDELVVDEKNIKSVWDYKTRGAAPKEGQTEQYYGLQADIYDLLLKEVIGYKTSGKAYFAYYWPIDSGEGDLLESIEGHKGQPFTFNNEIVTVETDSDRARDMVVKAINCLEGPMPYQDESCEYCKFATQNNVVKTEA